ncbi:hypothetical protein [Paraflavitalea pollutisoli]|uniref:hypothetical protein n=1 Tax=Paraflavitalea pollutisoli TaxID=3034143 RepID=UPI0023EC777A|nr:hypothetical protein [Paraflavitalea sp. H1-2-19X]
MKRGIFKMILLVVAVIGTTWLLANRIVIKNWKKEEPKPKQAERTETPDPAQLAMLDEMTQWLRPFDSLNVNCYYDARLTAIDKMDSAHAMINVPFRYARKGANCYFRIDQTENLFSKDGYMLVDHNARKILVTPPRSVMRGGMPDLRQLFKTITAEGYTMKKDRQGAAMTISMLSPNNINFKEFSVTYDSVVNRITKIFLRQSELSDPLNTEADKLMTIEFAQLSNVSIPDSCFRQQKFVVKNKDQWQCSTAYSEYELVAR